MSPLLEMVKTDGMLIWESLETSLQWSEQLMGMPHWEMGSPLRNALMVYTSRLQIGTQATNFFRYMLINIY